MKRGGGMLGESHKLAVIKALDMLEAFASVGAETFHLTLSA